MSSELTLFESEDTRHFHPGTTRQVLPQPSQHGTLDMTSLALRVEDVVSLIVEALPKPDSPSAIAIESPQSKAARSDLYHLASTAAIFFYPATGKLWESVYTWKHLLQVLADVEMPDARQGLAVNGDRGELRIYSITPDNCKDHPAYRRFRYYVACIKNLRVVSRDVPVSTLVHLRSLASPTDSLNLLPALRSLVWVETDPCMLHSDIAPFLRSSQLVSVSLHIENKNHEYATREHKVFCRDALLRLLCTVSSTSPSLGRLTIQAPPSIPLSGSLFRGFDCVLHANLRMCIGALSPSDTVVSLTRPRLATLERMDLSWTTESSAQEVVGHISLTNLRHLSISSTDGTLGTPFLGDMRVLTASTSIHLTTIEIMSLTPLRAPVVDGGDFMSFVRPLLLRSRLRHIAIVLPKFTFSFETSQLEALAHAWPKLNVLHISFLLGSYSMLPNMQYILPLITEQCPDLAFLHLPGIATLPNSGLFGLPARPSSNLRHISSDLMAIQHSPLDVAVALYTAFPKLAQLGPPGGDSDWVELHALVSAFRNLNYPVLLEHILQYMHGGVYASNRLPAALCYMAWRELFGSLADQHGLTPQALARLLATLVGGSAE